MRIKYFEERASKEYGFISMSGGLWYCSSVTKLLGPVYTPFTTETYHDKCFCNKPDSEKCAIEFILVLYNN